MVSNQLIPIVVGCGSLREMEANVNLMIQLVSSLASMISSYTTFYVGGLSGVLTTNLYESSSCVLDRGGVRLYAIIPSPNLIITCHFGVCSWVQALP